jgi:serine protease AprX
MAKVTIIAHVMHESERIAAEKTAKWENMHATDAFVMGDVNEDDIPKLEEHGIIVQRVPSPAEIKTKVRAVAKKLRRIPKAASATEVFEKGVGYLESISDTAKGRQGYLRVEMKGPLLQEMKNDLRKLGAKIIEVRPDKSLIARAEQSQADKIAELPWVMSSEEEEGEASTPVNSEIADARTGGQTEVGIVTFDVVTHEPEAVPFLDSWLRERNVQIVGVGRSKIRVVLPEDSPLIDEISILPEVDEVEPWIPPQLHTERARVLMKIEWPAASGNILSRFEGDGETVGVADSGLDDKHPDFQNRIVGQIDLGKRGTADDPHGHGTHVAGCALGDGAASNGIHKGTAPKAKLYFQSLLDANGKLGGLPVDLHDLFEPAYIAGVRVHNNSWGALAAGTYRSTSREVDQFVSDNRDMVIVFSAGNAGRSAEPTPPDQKMAKDGFVDWRSVGAPATAKNCITVGASRSDRTLGGYSTLSYGQAWPNDFPVSNNVPPNFTPIEKQSVSGDPEAMAGFSGRGPSDDYRIKPDVVAPGTDILSCKSSKAPIINFWGMSSSSGAQYAFAGGTSMAAPLVAGCAALVREFYRKDRNHEPSAALIKATLINGTRWLSSADATADHPNQPNLHQGFGAIDMSTTLPNFYATAPSGTPSLHVIFIDTWKSSNRLFKNAGESHQYSFTTAAAGSLRFCLAYTDRPQRGLQNNLNLFVQILSDSSKKKWYGNSQMPFSLGGPDTANNVEVLRLPNAVAGDYLIQISAQNLLGQNSAQDYALVVTSTSPFTTTQVVK